MPMNRDNYPDNWEEISLAKRQEAGQKCQRCGVPNDSLVTRNPENKQEWIAIIRTDEGIFILLHCSGVRLPWSEFPNTQYVRVVLTVGHVDQDPSNNDPDNLAVWCQFCHLNYDRPWNLDKMARKRVIASGQWALRL